MGAANHHGQPAETEAERLKKDTSGCGFTHEVQEKQQPRFGSCTQLDGFGIGHGIAPPEARPLSGGLDPLQLPLVCALMELASTVAQHNRHL